MQKLTSGFTRATHFKFRPSKRKKVEREVVLAPEEVKRFKNFTADALRMVNNAECMLIDPPSEEQAIELLECLEPLKAKIGLLEAKLI